MWLDAKGYEGRIQVTKCGMVRSVDRYVDNYPSGKRMLRGKVINCSLDKAGYKKVDLRMRSKSGTKGKLELLHRIIAETFIDNPVGYPVVNHIDGDKLNNRVDNLEWCTHEYNHSHAHRIGLCDKAKRAVLAMSCDVGYWYPFMRATIADGMNPSLVHAAINGGQNTHRGFQWDYCEPAERNS